MSRPLTGSLRQREGSWCASLPEAKGSVGRREERFVSEFEARRWLARAITAVEVGEPIPEPVRRNQGQAPGGDGTDQPTISPDVASVANAWMAAAYEDLRRAGPERADQVRRVVEAYLVPWFAPRTKTISDVTYYMAHDWLLHLVGRINAQRASAARRAVSERPADRGAVVDDEVGLAEAAARCGLSLATLRRRWRDGQIPGAHRDHRGDVRVPVRSLKQVRGARRRQAKPGLSKRVVADALWILRRILAFARANGLFPRGFDPIEGLEAPVPDPAASRTRTPTNQPRPLTLVECARVTSHLHAAHQLVFWLQRIMALRISEAFGLLVGDLVDLGEYGMLAVQGQGGRTFQVRDDTGTIVAVARKPTVKTAAGSRVLVVPTKMMELLRVVIEAFHTDPDTGTIDTSARLVPGIYAANRGGQLGYQMALTEATKDEELGTDDLGFRVSSHLLRKSVATDLAWASGIEDTVRRRFMGHRAGDDVFGRIYTLDHPDIAPLTKVAALLDDNIAAQITTLLTQTTRTIHWGRDNPLFWRADFVTAVLTAAGWQVEPGDPDDPLCDSKRVADELGIVATTARRWMTDGTLPSVVVPDGDGVPRRYSRLSDVWARRDELCSVIRLPDLADELGVRYDEIYRSVRHLGLCLDQHPTSREFRLTAEQADTLRAEHARVRALHLRSMKFAAAARQLKINFTTVRLLVKRGELDVDPETDTSGARFVTRASVEVCWLARNRSKRRTAERPPTVSFAEVMRFTGLGRRAVVDLVRAGVLEELPGRSSTCEITAASLDTWLAARDREPEAAPPMQARRTAQS